MALKPQLEELALASLLLKLWIFLYSWYDESLTLSSSFDSHSFIILLYSRWTCSQSPQGSTTSCILLVRITMDSGHPKYHCLMPPSLKQYNTSIKIAAIFEWDEASLRTFYNTHWSSAFLVSHLQTLAFYHHKMPKEIILFFKQVLKQFSIGCFLRWQRIILLFPPGYKFITQTR